MPIEAFRDEIDVLISIAVAVLLGFAIGFERKCRAKEAGIRTHTIVCAGAALMTALSKYGFSDAVDFDASRIASQIVSGIGFLGAGIIVYRKNQIHGLTTAAGVWATAGVGMAAGAKMYIAAVGSAVMLIFVQCILHLDLRIFRTRRSYLLHVDFMENGDTDSVKEILETEHFQSLIMKQTPEGIAYSATLFTDKEFSSKKLSEIMHENPYITAIERCDDE